LWIASYFPFCYDLNLRSFPPVPPKGDLAASSERFRSEKKRDPAAHDKDVYLKPSARSGSSPPPSAPGGDSSIFVDRQLFPFLLRYQPPKFPHLFRLRATWQLFLPPLVPRRTETRQRTARTSTSSLPFAAAAPHRPQRPVVTLQSFVDRQLFPFCNDLNLRSFPTCSAQGRPGSSFCALSFQEETRPDSARQGHRP
jgi:hypothetical protein